MKLEFALVSCCFASFTAFFDKTQYPAWDDASKACEEKGLTLAVIKNLQDQKEAYDSALESVIADNLDPKTVSFFHIGVRRSSGQSNWQWRYTNENNDRKTCSTGSMGKTFWGQNQPPTGFDAGYDCGILNLNDPRYPVEENWTAGICDDFNGLTGYICGPKVPVGSCSSSGGSGQGGAAKTIGLATTLLTLVVLIWNY